MSTPLFLLLGLLVATCVIAYWSDNLGKKLGKKRVTLLGLRPRQTATLITMSSSVLIMLFTFGALLATNSGLRGALLRYDKERADNQKLRQSNQKLRAEQGNLESEVEQARKAVGQATHQAQQAKNQARQANAEAQSAQRKYASVKTDLNQTQTQLGAARRAAQSARSSERAARRGEEAARRNASQVSQKLENSRAQLQEVNANLGQARVRLASLQKQLQSAQKNVAKAQDNLRIAKTQEKQATEKARRAQETYYRFESGAYKESAKLLRDIAQQQEEVRRLQSQQQDLQAGIRQLELIRYQLANQETDVREGVFADSTILARTNASQAIEQLNALLVQGKRVIGKDNPQRKLQLLLPNGLPVQPEVAVSTLADYVTTFKVPVSVRLTAVRNFAKAENEIQAALVPVPARLIFRRDDEITAMEINGGQSDARIFNQLLTLVNSGEDKARALGMAPLLKGDARFYTDGTNERIFAVLRRIQEAKGPVSVHLIAEKDTTALDQLQVRFEIGENDAAKIVNGKTSSNS